MLATLPVKLDDKQSLLYGVLNWVEANLLPTWVWAAQVCSLKTCKESCLIYHGGQRKAEASRLEWTCSWSSYPWS